MRTLETLVRDARRNAALAWVAVVLLVVAAGWSLVGGDLLWGGFALTGALVAVAPAVWTRDPERMLPAEILAVLTAVVVARVAGVAISFAGYSATAALALVLAVEIDVFTDVELTGWFSVPFVTVTTAALAAVWGVLEYASDLFLGTRYLTDTADLMWDLVLASAVGVLAGLLFWGYVRRYHRVADGADRDRTTPPDRDPHSLADSRLRYPVRAMQAVLVLVVVGGLVTARGGLVFNAGMGLVVALVPDLVRWRYGRPLSAGLALWLTVAGFLHGVGALGIYETVGWYDQLTHVVSASLVAGLGYATVQALDRYSPSVSLPTWFRVCCTVLFVLAFGVLWEVMEFATGGLSAVLGGEALLAQYGLRDVVLDLAFDGLGGLAVALWATRYFDGVSTFLTRRLRAGD
ncbi:hypothetical protein [Halorientalis halophila]|uniref:hypothetical protein n=1 Tax=Halorientalis halophila TaxID=3108499 RepID=UPI00300B3377